jgi:hypothetical protein
MFSSRLAFFAAISTLVGTTLATFQITSPSPNAWWGKYPIEAFLLSPNLMHRVIKSPTRRTLSRGVAMSTRRVRQMESIRSCESCRLSLPFFFLEAYSHSLCVVCRINNTSPTVYPGPGALLTNIANADCSELIGAAQVNALPVATGYTLLLADVGDETKVCCPLVLSLFLRFLTPLRITGLCRLAAI